MLLDDPNDTHVSKPKYPRPDAIANREQEEYILGMHHWYLSGVDSFKIQVLVLNSFRG